LADVGCWATLAETFNAFGHRHEASIAARVIESLDALEAGAHSE
jgi:hypothetical protein